MIICSDLHLRLDIPIGRVDNYLEAQEKKFRFILREAKKSPPLLIPGDLLDKACPPVELLYWIMSVIEDEGMPEIIVAPGQHDILWHNIKNIKKSAISLLHKGGFIKLVIDPTIPNVVGKGCAIWSCPYGFEPIAPVTKEGTVFENNILLWHHMIINKGEELWPGQNAPISGRILRQYKDYSLICTGDNHDYFLEKSGKRSLLNSGSMMRMEVDQKDHKPTIFKIEGNKIELISLPIEENVLDSSHITNKEERDYRMEEFLSKLKQVQLKGQNFVSFKTNLEQFFRFNKISKEVEETTWKFTGKGN